MAPKLALCSILVVASSFQSREIDGPTPLMTEPCTTLDNDSCEIPLETRLQWINSISEKFFTRPELADHSYIRDWDLIFSLDGSVENIADNQSSSSQLEKVYPVRYRLPSAILDRLTTNEEKIQRAELFALGSILYELISGKPLFQDSGRDEKDEEELQSFITEGEFPDDVWILPMAPRILACWCPTFAKELLAARGKDNFSKVISNYIRSHPVIFGFQVLGGAFAIASLVALPILGAVGFTAAGPLAGSIAATWQSSIGIVQGGSLFAWCQSAAMGGAAVGGILVTGLAGAGVAVGATVAGALDAKEGDEVPDLKGRFLSAWKRDTGDEKVE